MSLWLTVALVGLAGEMYFFFMQRSALEVCRARNVPTDGRFALLPAYYRFGRLPTLVKWTGVVALILQGEWLFGLGVLFGAWILSAILPVPHAAYFDIFYREVDDPTNDAPEELRTQMRVALESVDREFGVTGRS